MNRATQMAIIGAFVLGMLVAAYYAFTAPESTIQSRLAAGALGSLLASVVYGFLTFFLVRESAQDKKQFRECLAELERRDLQGVRHIRAKTDFEPEFWISLLSSASTSLDLAGHALSQWCEEPYRTSFVATLRRVASNGGKVRILLMRPDGDSHRRRQELVGTIYTERINMTLRTLRDEVIGTLAPSFRKNITIKWNGTADLHNVFIRTDNTVLVSPYLTTMNSRHAIQLVLTPDGRFGATYRSDFENLFERSELMDLVT